MKKLDTALFVAAASGVLTACGPSDAKIAENRSEILSRVESSVQNQTKELLNQGYVEYCRGVMAKKIVTKEGKTAYEIMTVVERYGKVLNGAVANPDYAGAYAEYRWVATDLHLGQNAVSLLDDSGRELWRANCYVPRKF